MEVPRACTRAIEEIQETPPDRAYIEYLATKIKPLVKQKDVSLPATTTQCTLQRPGASP